jgi:hypothetical protein
LERAASVAASKIAAPAALVGLMLVSALVRYWLARGVKTPWILVDEFLYAEEAKSFAASAHYTIRGAAGPILSYLYPALISPAWLARSMTTTYGVAKAINAVLMTLVAIPVYLWGSRLASRWWAVVAVGLTLLVPAFFYTGELMTENAFFPAFVTAMFTIALVLERPTLVGQALMLGAILLTVAVRFQGLVLLAVLPTALLLKLAFDLLGKDGDAPRQVVRRSLLPLWPTVTALALAALAYGAYKHHQGLSLSSGLGGYEVVTGGRYPLHTALRWILYHFAELPLAAGYIPACALLVLLGIAFLRPRTMTPAERSFVAVAAAGTTWLVAEVGVFASRYSFRVEERNMFGLAALLILALVLWLARGAPRPPLVTLVAVVLPAALLLTLPLATLLNASIFSDTFGLVPLLRLSQRLSGGVPLVRKLLIAGAVAAGLVFALTPRRFAAPVMVGCVAGFLVLSSYSVHGAIRDYARNLASGTGVLNDPTWVDDSAAGRDVGVLYGRSADTFQEAVALWETEFWNRRVGRVYTVGSNEPVGLAETPVLVRRRNGVLAAPVDPAVQRELSATRGFLADRGTDLAGKVRTGNGIFDLYTLRSPPQIASLVSGVYADGWMGSDASYTRYVAKRPGTIRVTVSRVSWRGPDVPGRVVVSLAARGAGAQTKRFTIHAGGFHVVRLDAPAKPFAIAIRVQPTFSPSQYGRPDARQLGGQVSFDYHVG